MERAWGSPPHAWWWESSGAEKPHRQQGVGFLPTLSGPGSPSVWPSRSKARAGGSSRVRPVLSGCRAGGPDCLDCPPAGRPWGQKRVEAARQRWQGSKAAHDGYGSRGDYSRQPVSVPAHVPIMFPLPLPLPRPATPQPPPTQTVNRRCSVQGMGVTGHNMHGSGRSQHACQWESSGANKPHRLQGAGFEPMLSGPIGPSVRPSHPKALAGGRVRPALSGCRAGGPVFLDSPLAGRPSGWGQACGSRATTEMPREQGGTERGRRQLTTCFCTCPCSDHVSTPAPVNATCARERDAAAAANADSKQEVQWRVTGHHMHGSGNRLGPTNHADSKGLSSSPCSQVP